MIERHYILAEDAGSNVQVANGQAALWDPDVGGDQTFGSADVSADGQTPRSHVVCNTLIDPDWPTDPTPTLLAFYANAFYEGYRITEANATDEALLTGTVERYNATLQQWETAASGQIEDVALNDMGLQRIILDDVSGPEPWTPSTYSQGDQVTYEAAGQTRVWESLVDANTGEPSVFGGWRDQTDPPLWVQPAGTVGIWNAGATVEHEGTIWDNTYGDGNSWEPGVFGWTQQ